MKRMILLIAMAVAALGLIGAGVVLHHGSGSGSPTGSATVYDSFLGFNVPKDQPSDQGKFYIYGSQALSADFNNLTLDTITQNIGSFAKDIIAPNVHRAKLVTNSISVPGNGTVTFRVIFDASDTGEYTVKITQVPQDTGLAGFVITSPKGVVTDLNGD